MQWTLVRDWMVVISLCANLFEALASRVSELEDLRDRVAKAERGIVGVAGETRARKAVYDGSAVGPAINAII
ncbi:hypothetical protein [Bradyrhizobium sp. CCBAU 21360]|uniref:hypothetical protein n=1 Tax=Bradyrhizobium sp. CCBAU 21360 TaxID=1325081 RepID=UPI002306BA87|nr:hypothetical protein [Bradyrhizobium sp. CCBAU 21360]